MTPIRKHAIIKKVKDITLSSSLLLAILGTTPIVQSCDSSRNNGAEGEYEEVEEYKKGVKTFITEIKPGVFKIQDEQEADVESSLAEITYIDGHKTTLDAQAAKSLIDKDINDKPNQVGKDESLSNALLYSGMGFLLAKTMAPTYTNYRPDMNPKLATVSKDSVGRTAHHRSLFFPLLFSRYYANNAAFARSNSVHDAITNSRSTSYRPAGGRSGFFRSTGRSVFGG